MVSKLGHIWPDSARTWRMQVVKWADEIWTRGGYQQARKDGWRIMKVAMVPIPPAHDATVTRSKEPDRRRRNDNG